MAAMSRRHPSHPEPPHVDPGATSRTSDPILEVLLDRLAEERNLSGQRIDQIRVILQTVLQEPEICLPLALQIKRDKEELRNWLCFQAIDDLFDRSGQPVDRADNPDRRPSPNLRRNRRLGYGDYGC